MKPCGVAKEQRTATRRWPTGQAVSERVAAEKWGLWRLACFIVANSVLSMRRGGIEGEAKTPPMNHINTPIVICDDTRTAQRC
ncbi:unnamed protein product [Heligmosomoides polygyrus]|uniref:Uncharacterized protein n=1 Tax=Heligmosomoides polygyrus TaxID=6339 RepID=A0A183G787_HELPZ|nr:unnamed protein product [Heligmosomoides polygyrus]